MAERKPGKTYLAEAEETAWTEQNGERYPGGVLPEKPAPFCLTYAGAGGFIVAGQLRPRECASIGRDGQHIVLTVLPYTLIG